MAELMEASRGIALAIAAEQIAAVRDIIGVDQRNLELVQLTTTADKSAQLDMMIVKSQLASDLAQACLGNARAKGQRHSDTALLFIARGGSNAISLDTAQPALRRD